MFKGYWEELYGTRSNEFIEGVIAGIEAYAIWAGKQYIDMFKGYWEEVIIKGVKDQLGYEKE